MLVAQPRFLEWWGNQFLGLIYRHKTKMNQRIMSIALCLEVQKIPTSLLNLPTYTILQTSSGRGRPCLLWIYVTVGKQLLNSFFFIHIE